MSITARAEAATGLQVCYVGGGLWVAARSWAEATAPVVWACDREEAAAGDFQGSPFRVADFCHGPGAAGSAVRRWLRSQGAL